MRRNECPAPDVHAARLLAARDANAQDADVWRWFSMLMDERRIRWCCAHGDWLVSVDHRHLATDRSFDRAIRAASRAHAAQRAVAAS